MTVTEHGGPRFADGMRVAREHLEHLRDTALAGIVGLREAAGPGRVVHGLRVEVEGAGSVTVGAGLAFDGAGRPLVLDEPASLPVAPEGTTTVYLTIAHVSRSEGIVDGVPTLVYDDAALATRPSPPPYDDGAVAFAGVTGGAAGLEVFQKGEWYLPPLSHGHSGEFRDDGGRWRYDGDPLGGAGAGPAEPEFDSGFVPLREGEGVSLVHGLQSIDLLVQTQARAGDVVTTRGLGTDFYYELPNEQEIRLVRGDETEGDLQVRAVIRRFGPSPGGPLLPLADAGDDAVVEPGESFVLDAGRSRAFGGKTLSRYVWRQVE